MKKQINTGSGNTQISDDDTTTQIQIGFSKWWVIVFISLILFWIFW